jgi:hypothetical protein
VQRYIVLEPEPPFRHGTECCWQLIWTDRVDRRGGPRDAGRLFVPGGAWQIIATMPKIGRIHLTVIKAVRQILSGR